MNLSLSWTFNITLISGLHGFAVWLLLCFQNFTTILFLFSFLFRPCSTKVIENNLFLHLLHRDSVCSDLTQGSLFNPSADDSSIAKYKPWVTGAESGWSWWDWADPEHWADLKALVCSSASVSNSTLVVIWQCYQHTEGGDHSSLLSVSETLEYCVQCWSPQYKRTYWSESSKGALKMMD